MNYEDAAKGIRIFLYMHCGLYAWLVHLLPSPASTQLWGHHYLIACKYRTEFGKYKNIEKKTAIIGNTRR